MFCTNCGQKLVDSNQKICQFCGSKVESSSEILNSQQIPKYTSFSEVKQKYMKNERPGTHSRKCLAFSIFSIAIAIAMLAISGILFIFYRIGMPLTIFIIGLTIAIIVHIFGLIFGFLSRMNSKEAFKSEPENPVEKVGSVFAIFGVIGNIILIIVAFIILAIVII